MSSISAAYGIGHGFAALREIALPIHIVPIGVGDSVIGPYLILGIRNDTSTKQGSRDPRGFVDTSSKPLFAKLD